MASGDSLSQFISKNAGVGGAVGGVLLAKDLADSESKLKGVASVLAQILTMKAGIAAMFIGTFGAAKKTMQDLVRETGSLDAALRRIGKGAQDANVALAKAKENMKAAAGGPWAEREITNTKNMTRAVEAMTPAVSSASNTWAKLTGGFSTFRSEVTRAAAESGILNSAISGVSNTAAFLAVGLGTVSKVYMANWFRGAGAAAAVSASQMTGWAAVAMRVASVAMRFTGVGLVTSVLTAGAGIVMSYVRAQEESANAALRMNRVSQEASQGINSQISNIRTAEDQMNAYASALDNATAAYRQFLDVRASGESPDSPKYQAARGAYETAQGYVAKAAGATPLEGAGSGTESAVHAAVIARALLRQGIQQQMEAASPEGRITLLQQAAATARGLATTGESEIAGRSATDTQLADIERRRQAAIQRTPGAALREMKIKELEGRQTSGNYYRGAPDIEGQEHGWGVGWGEERTAEELKRLRDEQEKGRDKYNPELFDNEKMNALKGSGSAAYKAMGAGMELESGKHGADYQARKEELAVSKEAADTAFKEAEEQRKAASAIEQQVRLLSPQVTEGMALVSIEEDLANSRLEGYALSVKEFEARRAALQVQLAMEQSQYGMNTERGRSLQTQIALEEKAQVLRERAHAAEMGEAAASLGRSMVPGTGFASEMQRRAHDRAEIQRRLAAPGLQDADRMRLQGQLFEHDQGTAQAVRANLVSRAELRLGRQGQRAALRGDVRGGQAVEDVSGALSSYEQNRGVLGGVAAKAFAISQAQDAIALSAMQGQGHASLSGAVSDLQRIGGGGGFEAVSEPLLDINRRQLEVAKNVEAILQQIADKSDTGGVKD